MEVIGYKLGFIGCGNMAEALILGIADKLIPAGDIIAYAPNQEKLNEKARRIGFTPAKSLAELCKQADRVILAVKPNVIPLVMRDAKDLLAGKAVISVAAGVSTNKLSEGLPDSRVLRVMPNTPALVGEGATALCMDTTNFTAEEKQWAEELFSAVGTAIWVEERLMDAVVGVSGSGPAYVFMFIEALADGGVREGLPRDVALKLAAQTVIGAGKLLADSKKHPGELKDMVCSPGGTTIEAVASLEKDGFRGAVIDAVRVCAKKSRELG
ncbi:MAG: pyrroline-5-carboxylate reductase [Christensenellales bacterium]|jgi:pyrroline-5-carboxylate reductase